MSAHKRRKPGGIRLEGAADAASGGDHPDTERPRTSGSTRRGSRNLKCGSASVLTALMLIGATACYHYRAVPRQPISDSAVGGAPQPATEYEGETVWALFWGLAQENPTIDNCQGQPLAEVRTSTNLGFTIVSVVSLGFASPARIQWKCAKAQPEPTPIGEPDTADASTLLEENPVSADRRQPRDRVIPRGENR